MGITNKTNFENASAVYRTLFDEVFLGASDPSANNWELYSRSESISGTSFEYRFLNSLPDPRKWIGEKEYKASRANKHRIDVEDFEESTSVSKLDWLQDPEGVGRTLRAWLASKNGYINSIVINKLLKGDVDTGYDGTALFGTHANGGSPQTNKSTNALDQANYRAAKAAMRSLKGPAGRPLGIRPDLLLVGPALEDVARDVIEARDRVQVVTEAGANVGGASIENVVSADGVRLVVEPRIDGGLNGSGGDTSNHWFLMDSRYAPMIVGIAQAPQPSDDTSAFIPGAPELHFSVEAQLAVGYGLYEGVYGNLAI